MSDQKYYVGLKSLIDENVITHFLWKDHCFYRGFEKSKCSFTKSEFADIMDGALYKPENHHDCMWTFDCRGYCRPEWINPLIALVPTEEDEK